MGTELNQIGKDALKVQESISEKSVKEKTMDQLVIANKILEGAKGNEKLEKKFKLAYVNLNRSILDSLKADNKITKKELDNIKTETQNLESQFTDSPEIPEIPQINLSDDDNDDITSYTPSFGKNTPDWNFYGTKSNMHPKVPQINLSDDDNDDITTDTPSFGKNTQDRNFYNTGNSEDNFGFNNMNDYYYGASENDLAYTSVFFSDEENAQIMKETKEINDWLYDIDNQYGEDDWENDLKDYDYDFTDYELEEYDLADYDFVGSSVDGYEIVNHQNHDKIQITEKEEKIVKKNPEALKNLIDFHNFFKKLHLESVWKYRDQLALSFGDVNIDLNDSNAISKTELIRIGNKLIDFINNVWETNEENGTPSNKISKSDTIGGLTNNLRKFSQANGLLSNEKTFNIYGEDKFAAVLRSLGIIGSSYFKTNELRKIIEKKD